MARRVSMVLVNIRSALNVGAIFRTADAMAVERIYLVGYTPYPKQKADRRLPHVAGRADRQIAKTALGAEKSVPFSQLPAAELPALLANLKSAGYAVIGLEQTPDAGALNTFAPPAKAALVAGNEVRGLGPAVIGQVDKVVEIPMAGQKESLNVAAAAAIALYHFRYAPGVDKHKL